MTYRELKNALSSLSEDELDMPVVHVVYGDVVTPVVALSIAPPDGDLADGILPNQPILMAE